jgi:uncharacterized membrane protein YukC
VNTVIEKQYQNSKHPAQRMFLTFARVQLLPCALTQYQENYVLAFETQNMQPFDSVLDIDAAERYRALANAADLVDLQKEYTFSLAPSNLWVDVNLIAKVMERDTASNWSFIDGYKALIGTTLLPAYSYEDFLARGELFGKKAILNKISNMITVAEIKSALLDEYIDITDNQQKNFVLLKKTTVVRNRLLIPILAAITAITFVAAGWFIFYRIPYDNAVQQAYACYEANDYIAACDAMANIPVGRMTADIKLMLARSYVRTEVTGSEERERILSGLLAKPQDQALDYWIYLGRGEYERAAGCARDLKDDELLLRALEQYKTIVEWDTKMSPADKAALLTDLNDEINGLKKDAPADDILRITQTNEGTDDNSPDNEDVDDNSADENETQPTLSLP